MLKAAMNKTLLALSILEDSLRAARLPAGDSVLEDLREIEATKTQLQNLLKAFIAKHYQ